MEFLKITCVTCRAGLSVRDESLIGQIVACPRCGSMVQVTPPVEVGDPPAEVGSPEETGTPVDWEASATATNSRMIAWSVTGLVVGLTLIGAVMFWPSRVAVSDAALPEVSSTPAVPKPLDSPVAKTPVTPIDSEETVTEEPGDVPALEAPSLPPVEPEVIEQKVDKAPVKIAKLQAETAPVEPPRLARQFNPLELDPEGLDLTTLHHMIEHDKEVMPETGSADEEESSVDQETSTEPIVRRGADPQGNHSSKDAKESLSVKFPALELRGMTLMNFLTLISKLSGSPVSVTAEQLQMAGLSPRQRVSFSARHVTLEDAISEVLAPLQLEHVYRGPQVIVLRQGAEEQREIDYPIDDLISLQTDAEQLVTWIRQLVAPESWQGSKLEVVGDSLQIEQTQRVHYQVLVFLERLRLVRDLPPRSRYPIERLAPTPLHAAMARRLTASALFTFSRETPLREVLLHWQRELDLPLLVDWPALAELELWPDSKIVCAVADRPWHEVFTEVLQQLGLDWRASFGGAIEISSAARFRQELQLELYPLASVYAIDGEQTIADLREHLTQKLRADSWPAKSDLVFEPTSQSIIARQPAAAQREILDWLKGRKLFRSESPGGATPGL